MPPASRFEGRRRAPIDEWQQVMDVNMRGTFLVCQAVGRVMIKQRSGRIVNLSSVRGRYGLPANYAAYCPSKGAVTLAPWDSLYIPPNEGREILNKTNKPATMLVIVNY